ncbi:MAG: xylanase [Clostridiales bacterium]|nr:xylanase [Clostridiales bacterium]
MAVISVDLKKEYQSFEGFGASGAWWAQLVGGWEHSDPVSGMAVRDRISQLLFSKDKGIALRTYRYNLGGGSKEAGNGKFPNPLRRAECFLNEKGKPDFTKDKNAVYMMRKAVNDGAEELIFFVNSPPVCFTKNGKAHSDTAGRENLPKKNYRKFANYCLDVAQHFISEGLPVKYLSPVNEPLWVWTGGQEGCHYRPRSVRKVFEVFAEELEKRPNLKGLKLSGAENGDIRWFNKSYTRQLLKSPMVRKYLDSVDVHSYCLPAPFKFLNNRTAYLKRFRKWMDKHYPEIPVKMSEWTHMKGGRDYGMDSALEMARVMYEDISILHVTSWQHWIAVSEVDYCDGLIYINLEDKSFELTKRYFATGNFSKYVSHMAKRVEAKTDDPDILPLAFKGENTVVILINPTAEEKTVTINNLSGSARLIVTDDNKNLEETPLSSLENIKLTPRSVNTVVLNE